MLDRDAVEEFLDGEIDELDFDVPKDVDKTKLVETFCLFAENDYYEWLKDNFNSFFNHGEPDWDWIRSKIKS